MGERYAQPVIGLTGGIGAGKSAVARMLADSGCIVTDSDADGRTALRVPEIRDTLVGWWGGEILGADGEVDRGAVASIVFSDPAERRRLEGLTHPWIERRRRMLFDAAPTTAPALVIDAPLLLEAGLDKACDAVIFVDTPRAVRLERVRGGRGWDDAELVRREESQLPLDVKRSRADHVLRNDGDLSDLAAQVQAALSKIVDAHRG